MQKIKVGILGTGNIGTDILIKLKRSDILECGMFAGISHDSKGIEMAKAMSVPISYDSINAFVNNPNCCDIIFDATSASAHIANETIFKRLNKYVIDLTPSNIGKKCVPFINGDDCLDVKEINLITCGGQGTIPIAYAISKIHPEIKYIEIVATIASKSAGIGTRNNIDEFTQTTSDALKEFTGIKNSKAIIVLNPAEPPITMHNTIYALIDNPKITEITEEVKKIEKEIRKYVPGYKVTVMPTYDNGKLTTMVEVTGLGDYLPKYAGNLDIITCAAIEMAEKYAERIVSE